MKKYCKYCGELLVDGVCQCESCKACCNEVAEPATPEVPVEKFKRIALGVLKNPYSVTRSIKSSDLKESLMIGGGALAVSILSCFLINLGDFGSSIKSGAAVILGCLIIMSVVLYVGGIAIATKKHDKDYLLSLVAKMGLAHLPITCLQLIGAICSYLSATLMSVVYVAGLVLWLLYTNEIIRSELRGRNNVASAITITSVIVGAWLFSTIVMNYISSLMSSFSLFSFL